MGLSVPKKMGVKNSIHLVVSSTISKAIAHGDRRRPNLYQRLQTTVKLWVFSSVIFVNENENEKMMKTKTKLKRKNRKRLKTKTKKIENENENENAKIAKLVTQRKCQHTIRRSIRCADVM